MFIVKLTYYDSNEILRKNEFFSGFGGAFVTRYEISEPVIETAVNSVGHFSFTVYPSHPLYEFVDKPKSIIEVTGYDRKEPLFIGRLAECSIGFYNEKRLVFESELAFLLDSVRTDFNSTVGYSAKYWLENILNYHNNHAGNFGEIYTNNIQRKFIIGNVSREILTQFVDIPAEKFRGTYTTLDIIRMLLLDKCGGVLKIRHENNQNYIDWLSGDDIHTCVQKIELAKNLLDIENNFERAEIVSAIRPVGENVTLENGEAVPLDLMLFDASAYISDSDICQAVDSTVTETSDLKFTDTMYSKKLVDKYGWIQKEVFFSGVVNKNALVRSAERFLRGVTEKNNITIKAVDLSSVDSGIEDFEAGDTVLLNSPAHFPGERKFQINSVVLNLSDPSASEITVGTDDLGFVSQVSGRSGSSNTYESYERLNKFTTQTQLYIDTTGGSSPLTATVPNLFKNYFSVVCNIVTSNEKYSLTLPLQYIKSLGTEEYYEAEGLLFYYVDDSNIRISTGLTQSNPTINSITIIGLY